MEYPHLSNAPIREAIIDIRVKHGSNFDVNEFRSLEKEMSKDFPKMEERKAYSASINFGPEKANFQGENNELDAIIFRNEEKSEVLQFKKQGFTFNKLKPYTSWEDVIEKAKMAWEKYVQVSKPVAVTRIATRYINHILIPISSNLEDYITNPPKLPPKAPSLFEGALSRIKLVDEENDIFVNLTQAIESREKKAAIILDIDAFRKKEYDLEEEFPWEDFSQLREMKNRIFFSSLTEKAINLYK